MTKTMRNPSANQIKARVLWQWGKQDYKLRLAIDLASLHKGGMTSRELFRFLRALRGLAVIGGEVKDNLHEDNDNIFIGL